MLQFELYSVGSGAFLRDVFNGLAMITGTGEFSRCVSIGLLLGVLVVCVQSVLQGGKSIAWQNILLGWLLYMCFFAVPTRAVVEDVYSGQIYTVDNVPLGVSATGSIVSKIGYGLTDLMETGYGDEERVTQIPYLSTLKYILHAQSGLSSATVLERLNALSGVKVQPTLLSYAEQCLIPALNAQEAAEARPVARIPIRDLLEKGAADEARGGTVWWNDRRQEGRSCREMYRLIDSNIVRHITPGELQAVLLEYAGIDQRDRFAQSMDLGTAVGTFTNDAASAQNYMITALMEPVIAMSAARFFSSQDRIAALSLNQALKQRNVQWASEQSMWTAVAQPLMGFFEGFFYAIAPFMAILFCLGMYGISLVGKYLQTIVWINLWMPVMSICNLYIMSVTHEKIINTTMGQLDTFYNLSTAREILENQLAVGGMLAAATPVLALIVVTGSTYAFTTLTGRINGADHFNEKLLRPDVLASGAAAEVASQYQHNPSTGTLAVGAQSQLMTINTAEQQDKAVMSAQSVMQQKTESYQEALSHNLQFQQAAMKNETFRKELMAQIGNDQTLSRSAGFDSALQNIKAGTVGVSGGSGGIFGGLMKFFSAEKGAEMPGTVSAEGGLKHTTQSSTQAGEGAGIEAKLKEAITRAVAHAGGAVKSRTGSTAEGEALQKQAAESLSAAETYNESVSRRTAIGTGETVDEAQIGRRYESGTLRGAYGKDARREAQDIIRTMREGGYRGGKSRELEFQQLMKIAMASAGQGFGLQSVSQAEAAAAVRMGLGAGANADEREAALKLMQCAGYNLGRDTGDAEQSARLKGAAPAEGVRERVNEKVLSSEKISGRVGRVQRLVGGFTQGTPRGSGLSGSDLQYNQREYAGKAELVGRNADNYRAYEKAGANAVYDAGMTVAQTAGAAVKSLDKTFDQRDPKKSEARLKELREKQAAGTYQDQ